MSHFLKFLLFFCLRRHIQGNTAVSDVEKCSVYVSSSFMISGFTLVFVFVYGVRKCSSLILLHVVVIFPVPFNEEILFFSHYIPLPPLSRLIDDRYIGFPGGSDGQESACSAGVLGSIPGSGRSPGEGNSCPLQYSCLEIPGREGQATVHGVTKSDMTEWLSHYFQALYSVPSIYSNIRFCTNATLLWWLSLYSVVWSQEVCSSCFISYIFPLQGCFLTSRSFVVPYKCWDLFS